MTDQNYSYHEKIGNMAVPLKLWDSHEPFEDSAMEQLRNVAKLPFIHSHVAGMPDVHWGMGATHIHPSQNSLNLGHLNPNLSAQSAVLQRTPNPTP